MAEEGFYSFEEALTELHLKEEELKRLVSEGEIRAFRQGDTMRLRRADVHNLRNELSGGEVVDLGGMGEDLVFEDDADLETGMATEEISDADTILEDDVEDIGELELEDEEPEPAPARAAAAGAAASSVRRPRAAAAARTEEEEEEPVWAKAVLIATSVLLVLSIPVVMSVARGLPSELAKGIAGMFGGEFSG